MSNDFDNNKSKAGHSQQIENYEQYLLYNKAAIIQKLRQLGKSKNNITAHFGGGKYSMLTQIIDVLPDMDLVVLDYGSNEKINKKILETERVVFKTQHEGITAQFSSDKLQKAKRHGKVAFACKIPESLLWVQRREFYRVRVPLSDNVTCELIHENNILIPYPVLDISIAGIALQDTEREYPIETGMIFNNCKLNLPDETSSNVNLEIANQLPLKNDAPDAGSRFGSHFINIDTDTSAKIQRYIYRIEMVNRRTKD